MSARLKQSDDIQIKLPLDNTCGMLTRNFELFLGDKIFHKLVSQTLSRLPCSYA